MFKTTLATLVAVGIFAASTAAQAGPATEASKRGIIIVEIKPSDGSEYGIIIIGIKPSDGSENGIIIVENKPSDGPQELRPGYNQ